MEFFQAIANMSGDKQSIEGELFSAICNDSEP